MVRMYNIIVGTNVRKYGQMLDCNEIISAVGLGIAESIAKFGDEPRYWHQSAKWRVLSALRNDRKYRRKLSYLSDTLGIQDGKPFTYENILVAAPQGWKEPPNPGAPKGSGYQKPLTVFKAMTEMSRLR